MIFKAANTGTVWDGLATVSGKIYDGLPIGFDMFWQYPPLVSKGFGRIPDYSCKVFDRLPIGCEMCLVGFPIRFGMTLHGVSHWI